MTPLSRYVVETLVTLMAVVALAVLLLSALRRVGGGKLGGPLELLARLPHSNASLTLTRGLFTASRDDGAYVESDFVENVGVAPDIEHPLTVDDFRAGFVGYVAHFSDAIVAQIEARSPAGPPESSPPAPPGPDTTPH